MPDLFRPRGGDYIVSVVEPSAKDSLVNPPSKVRKVAKNIHRKVVTVLVTMMLAMLGLLGAIGSAVPAHANPVSDGIKSAACSVGMYNYELMTNPTILSATTGDETAYNATPYEKYGLSGLHYTVWLGPERQEGLDNKGEFGGKQIVNFVGGKGASNIDSVGDDVANGKSGEATQAFPGYYNTQQTCVPMMNVAFTTVSNAVLPITGIVVYVTNTIYQTSYEAGSSILVMAAGPIETIVGAMLDGVYFEFLTVIIMFGALWMAWTGLVKRSSIQAAQGALWMIGSAVASVAIMSSPMWLPEKVHGITTSVSNITMNAAMTMTDDEADTNMCLVSAPGPSSDDALVPGQKPKETVVNNESIQRANIRQFQCTMWYNFLYTPWVIGEFGENPATPAENGPLLKGWNEAVSGGDINGQKQISPVEHVNFNISGSSPAPAGAQSWALYQLDNKIKYKGSTKEQQLEQKQSLMNVPLAQLHTDDYNATYKGDDAMNRLSVTTLSLVSSLGAAAFVTVTGISIIVMDIGLVFLMLISPLILLAGAHPGFGRRIALSWVEQIVGIAIKRIVLSTFLGIVIGFYSIVFRIDAPWVFTMILVIAVTFAGFKYQKVATGMFDNLANLGGGINMNPAGDGNGAEKAKNMARKAGSGAMALAGAGALGGAASRVGGKKAAMAAARGEDAVAGAGKRVAPKAKQNTTPTGPTPNEVPATRKEKRSAGGSQERVNPNKREEAPESSPVNSAGGVPRTKDPVSAPVEETASAPVAPVELSRKEMNRELKDAGYRSRVGVGTVAKAALRGAVVGTITGKPIAGAMAGMGVVSKEKAVIRARNADAVSTVADRLRPKEQPVEKKEKVKPASVPAPAKSTTSPAQKAPESKQKQGSQSPLPRNEGTAKKPTQSLPSVPENKPKKAPTSAKANKVEPNNPRSVPRPETQPQKRSTGSLPTPRPKQ